jgi:hypothetical protein
MGHSRQQLDAAFARLERCAAAGERCPLNGTQGMDSTISATLAREGRIEVEVFARNFRRVRILTGPHAGAMTAGPARAGAKPYVIVNTQTIRHEKPYGYRPSRARRKPSAPRPLTAEELRDG